jgi:hypothetical protein
MHCPQLAGCAVDGGLVLDEVVVPVMDHLDQLVLLPFERFLGLPVLLGFLAA